MAGQKNMLNGFLDGAPLTVAVGEGDPKSAFTQPHANWQGIGVEAKEEVFDLQFHRHALDTHQHIAAGIRGKPTPV